METELLKQTKQHFSKLGIMYFAGTLIIYGIQMLATLIGQIINPNLLTNQNYTLLLSMLPMYIIAMPLMALLITKFVPAVQIEKRKMSLGQWLIAFIMCYAIMYLSNLVGQAITMVIGAVKGSAVDNLIVDVAGNLNPVVSILLMVFCAPIAEEFIFRKLLIDRTVKYGEGVAVLFSGLMFGLFHGNLNQFAYAFTLGIFFGFIYVKTGMIRYTILMHMLINFLGSVVSMQLLNNSGYMDIVGSMNDPDALSAILTEHLPQLIFFAVYMLLVMGMVIAGIVLLIVKAKRFVLNAGEIEIPKGKRFRTTIVNLGMILFILFWLIMIVVQLFQ